MLVQIVPGGIVSRPGALKTLFIHLVLADLARGLVQRHAADPLDGLERAGAGCP